MGKKPDYVASTQLDGEYEEVGAGWTNQKNDGTKYISLRLDMGIFGTKTVNLFRREEVEDEKQEKKEDTSKSDDFIKREKVQGGD